jgi:DNA-binding HxlR family transcriptional regulator
MLKEVTPRSSCPISFSLDFLGDKWNLLILRDMIFNEKYSYGEFLESHEKIATNILANRLAFLEGNGFVQKRVASYNKSKFIYSLTEKGITLLPIIAEMVIWGSAFNPGNTLDQVQKELSKNKVSAIARYTEILRERLETANREVAAAQKTAV